MADISQITLPSNETYDFKDLVARREHNPLPLETKTYTDVIATANDQNGAGFFYLKVVPDTMTTIWHVKVHVVATVPGNAAYYTDTTFDLWGCSNTYCGYRCKNHIYSTSYRPIYYNTYFITNSTGYTNGCGHWIGFSLISSTNPTNTSLKRTVTVDLLQYENCSVEMQDTLITPTNIPNRAAHTGWYASTNTSYTQFNACDNGFKQSGDANTTYSFFNNLNHNTGAYIANSAIYRYQMVFHIDADKVTPLNNVSNGYASTTKAMLTDVDIDPFGEIYYYATTSTINANATFIQYLYWACGSIDLRYTFNITSSGPLVANKNVYLKTIPQANGKVRLATGLPLVQELPTENDGFWYIFLGRTSSTYLMSLHHHHEVYMHDGTRIRQIDSRIFDNAMKVVDDGTGIVVMPVF